MAQRVKLSSDTGHHSFSEEEKNAFVEHINNRLGHDAHLKNKLPIKAEGMDLFEKCTDGLVLWYVVLCCFL